MPCLPFHALRLPTLLLLLGSLPAWAAPPAAAAPASAASADWTDPQSQLSWARCVEGMQWTGQACAGQPLLLTHAQALARAAARAKEDGLPWRVPRVPELRHLLEKAGKPAAPGTQLPPAPAGWLWTATANVRQDKPNPYNYGNAMNNRGSNANDTPFLLGWAVEAPGGEARGDIPKSRPLAVRLVRSKP
ncbi:DUF1566 domain-containing protein [Pelomonas sp. V22]|uniref:Lcl domain-containing protein n=1 Tax=Pelomonas sp. V22 TaxID=2822139 RepID=UPI0024A7EEAE|nr:DUF1566 domain-containing protein [Pelomonas sp. V22]MDI4632806.1 DUF1566 domain-containing protein [Pelomonas sp. V22]